MRPNRCDNHIKLQFMISVHDVIHVMWMIVRVSRTDGETSPAVVPISQLFLTPNLYECISSSLT